MKHLRTIAIVAMLTALAAVTLGTYVPPPRQVPAFLNYFGDGSETDPNPSGTVTLGGEHNYASFTVGAGTTVNLVENFNQPPSSTLVVRSPGKCTIAGAIRGRGAANPVYTISGIGGGGGDPSAAGLQAVGVISASLDFNGGAGGAAGNPGGTGQDGAVLPDPVKTFVLDAMISLFDSSGGMPGGAGAGAANPFNCHNAEPGDGGCGGAGVVLVCREIDFQATAVVDLRGQDGFAGATGAGGGGGGGGGYFFTFAIAYIHSPANTGTVMLDGGQGGAGGDGTAGAGGKGSAGWSRFL